MGFIKLVQERALHVETIAVSFKISLPDGFSFKIRPAYNGEEH